MIDEDDTKRPTALEALSEAMKYFIKYYVKNNFFIASIIFRM